MKNEAITLTHDEIKITGPFDKVVSLLSATQREKEKELRGIFDSLLNDCTGPRLNYPNDKILMIKIAKNFFDCGLKDAKEWVEQNYC